MRTRQGPAQPGTPSMALDELWHRNRITVPSSLALGMNGHLARFFDSPGRVKHFDRYDVAGRIVVEDHSRLVLIALGDRNIAEDHGQRVSLGVVIHLHVLLQYFSILLVR